MKNLQKKIPDHKIRVIFQAYRILLSVLLAVLAVLLCVSCFEIYQSGEMPFSRESVSAAFSKMAPIVYGTVAAVIGGGLFAFFSATEEKRLKASVPLDDRINRLTGRFGGQIPEETALRVKKERRLRTLLTAFSATLLAFATVLAVVYALAKGNLSTDDINGSIAKFAWLLFAVYAVPFLFAVLCGVLSNASRKRELELLQDAFKSLPNPNSAQNTAPVLHFPKKPQFVMSVRIALMLLGCVFLIIGIINGGNEDVVQKAIKICRECIGLG